MKVRRIAAVLVIQALTASAAAAQDRLFVNDDEVGAFGRFAQKIGEIPGLPAGSFIGGGRYFVVRPFAEGVLVYDVRTGAEVLRTSDVVAAADPIRSRLFVRSGSQVSVMHVPSGELTPLVTAQPFRLVVQTTSIVSPPEFAYAPIADELFVRRGRDDQSPELAVVDATSGAAKRTLNDPGMSASFLIDSGIPPDFFVVSEDGRRLFVQVPSLGRQTLRSLDATTGATIGEASFNFGIGSLILDPVFGRFLTRGGGGQPIRAFDENAAQVGILDNGYCPASIRVSPHTGRIYVLRTLGGLGSYYGAIDTHLTVVDGASGTLLDDRSVTNELSLSTDRPVCSTLDLTLMTAPGPPRNLRATVAGSTVTIAWDNIGAASHFVLEAGVAPGQAALSVLLDSSARATFTGVPPGTYYVRVRGGNAVGGGRPSQDVTVIVP